LDVVYDWRGPFENLELNGLHAEAFGHRILGDDWVGQLERHSLGWVTARMEGRLVGFVNVAWDGGVHAFILDTLTAAHAQRQGIGTRLVRLATERARDAGCEWLHVDFEPHLTRFYLEECGSRSTPAGVIALQSG